MSDSTAGPSTERPFRRDGLFRRAWPFAGVAVLAAASVALPPGPKSIGDTAASVFLLALVGAAFFLPWDRLPSVLTVLVPLGYTASVILLIYAAGGPTFGVGIVILIPLIWTALHHRRWESAVVVAGIVCVQVVTSLVPLAVPGTVLARRILFWSALGALISIAAHDLRDRVGHMIEVRDEQQRRTVSLVAAAQELTSSLSPADVLSAATRIAAEMVSPPGTPARRAHYTRVSAGTFRIVAQYDEAGQFVAQTFPLAEHPPLAEVMRTGKASQRDLGAEALGPAVREVIRQSGVTHCIYVPVYCDGSIDGVLSVPLRGRRASSELFEQCQAVGHLAELALSNALAHEALAEQHRRLHAAEVIGHIGSWELDLETHAVTWSDTLFELHGLDPHGFRADYRAAMANIHPEDLEGLQAALDACEQTGAALDIRHRVVLPSDGRLRWFEVRADRVTETGRPARLTGSVIDVSEQVWAKEELEAARDVALAASLHKSSFLATMSHEIRTPMNAVIGITGLLLDTVLDADQREFVETVRSSGDALLTIINDILDFSKIEAGGLELEHQTFDLRDCVEDALDVAAATNNKGIELLGYLDDRCSRRVVGDVTRLRQVLVNLLGNAVKFTEKGNVVLAVEPDGRGEDEVGLRFSVTDTGIGIPADRLASLFDSFSQVDTSTTRLYGGTGLGLAISKQLVEAMGGTLVVQSVEGEGSTFAFSVPLGRGGEPVATGVMGREEQVSGRSVLVVDDNSTNRRILRLQLEGWGMNVAEAASGAAACALVESGTRFDVALVDMKMPEMTGQELAVRLRETVATGAVPLILLSSRGDRGQLERPDLFVAVLTKPVRTARLKESLTAALSSGVLPDHHLSPRSETSGRTGPKRLLLVEDNAVNQRVGRLMLEKLGHRVDVAGNGAEAVAAVGLVPYDAVFMDVQMPKMDGLDATRAIRSGLSAARQPYIVALTASALAEDHQACTDAGMDDYLAKPARLSDYETALSRAQAHLDTTNQFPSLSACHGRLLERPTR